MCSCNTYKPYLMRIEKVTDEAPGVKSFRLNFPKTATGNNSSLKPDSLASIQFSAKENRHSALLLHRLVRITLNVRSGKPDG